MSGLQLMIPPFVACMVLVAMLSYLGLHVIAREVIFVDLSLAQMAALGGLSAAAAGLMIATGIRLLMPHRTRRTALLFAALAFTGMVFVKLPLLVVLLGLAPVSIAVARIASARAP